MMYLSRILALCAMISAPAIYAEAVPATVPANATDTAGSSESVTITDAYVRGLPPGQPVTAAFMQWHNVSSAPQKLVSMASPAAERVELHSHSMAGGVMQMRKVDDLTLKPEQTLVLEPGGYHLMLMGLKQPLRDGETVSLTICFETGCVAVDAPVVSVLNEHSHHHH